MSLYSRHIQEQNEKSKDKGQADHTDDQGKREVGRGTGGKEKWRERGGRRGGEQVTWSSPCGVLPLPALHVPLPKMLASCSSYSPMLRFSTSMQGPISRSKAFTSSTATHHHHTTGTITHTQLSTPQAH